jgi:hypothetical protein
LVASMLFGYNINYLMAISNENFYHNAFFHYWILIDCLLMLLTLGYTQLAKHLQIKGEIVSNIFTLIFL